MGCTHRSTVTPPSTGLLHRPLVISTRSRVKESATHALGIRSDRHIPAATPSWRYRAMFVRHESPAPLDEKIVEALSQVQTSTLGHLRDHGFPQGLQPLSRPLKFVGSAVTV